MKLNENMETDLVKKVPCYYEFSVISSYVLLEPYLDTSEILKLLEIIVWPIVVLLAIYTIKPIVGQMLSGSKVKLSIAGQSIETTLPILQQVIEEQAGGALDTEHINYLEKLKNSRKQYDEGELDKNDRKFLRPLRNAGLIHTVPKNVFLSQAKAIELSGLGRLFIRLK